MDRKQQQSERMDTHYSLEGFYVPGDPTAQRALRPKAHRRRRGLTMVLVLLLAIGSLIWYRSQAATCGDVTPPTLNTSFSILHPFSSLRARRAELTTWNALSSGDAAAEAHELMLEDEFFRRATTGARTWQILLLGTPAQLAPPLDKPLTVTSPFGLREHPVIGKRLEHHGVDLAAAMGTPVRAAGRGVVAWAGHKWGYGNCIVLRHSRHLATIYGHLSHIGVHTGQSVSCDEIIGLSGSTGLSTGPHLHFEVRRDGIPVDPLPLLAPARAAISLNSCYTAGGKPWNPDRNIYVGRKGQEDSCGSLCRSPSL